MSKNFLSREIVVENIGFEPITYPTIGRLAGPFVINDVQISNLIKNKFVLNIPILLRQANT